MSDFEKTLQRNALKHLQAKGYWAVNVHGSEFQSGVPDILACVKGKFCAFEVKTDTGQLSALQRLNLKKIRQAGGIAITIRTFADFKTELTRIETDSKLDANG